MRVPSGVLLCSGALAWQLTGLCAVKHCDTSSHRRDLCFPRLGISLSWKQRSRKMKHCAQGHTAHDSRACRCVFPHCNSGAASTRGMAHAI